MRDLVRQNNAYSGGLFGAFGRADLLDHSQGYKEYVIVVRFTGI